MLTFEFPKDAGTFRSYGAGVVELSAVSINIRLLRS